MGIRTAKIAIYIGQVVLDLIKKRLRSVAEPLSKLFNEKDSVN